MKKLSSLFTAFLLAGSLVLCESAVVEAQTTTVSSLMKVLKEDKQKAVYNVNLNAPFTKETSGIRESVSSETGEVTVSNTIFQIPGRNGMDLSLSLEYRNRDAKLYNEGTKGGNVYNGYGQSIVAWYDVFDANGYWLETGGLVYPAGYTIEAETNLDGHRWVFNGYMQYENGTSLMTGGDINNTTVQKSVYNNAEYIFGEGWKLDMPSLEVEDDNVWAELPNGQTYKADFTTGTGLADYELTDIIFSIDTTYGNGVDASKYKLYYANGDTYYFSDKGELLVEMDRFRNAIRYYYETVNGQRLLTKIVDSVGRSIDIQYNDTVTIFKSGEKTVSLIKTPVPGVPGKYYLSSYIDELGRESRYNYTFQEAAFDQVGKAPANNSYANLIEISYPTGAKTEYIYEKSTKNIGTSGYMEYFKVKERRDVDGERIFNQLNYQYYNEPDGYPTYKANAIDELYKYYSTVTDTKGLTTKYMYNAKHQLYNVQQHTTRLVNETITEYHPKYNLQTKLTNKSYNEHGDISERVNTYEYDHRGNVIVENHPEDINDVDSDERKIFNSFDYKYNLLTSKRFKKDKDTTVEILYELTPDKKNVEAQSILENNKLLSLKEFEYDDHGNIITERVEKEPGEWVTSTMEYSQEYQGAYPTSIIAEDVKDADGNTTDIQVKYTYDFATGNRLSTTDGNNNTSSYEYDALGRILTETYPDKTYSSYSYDDFNNVLESTNANGNKLVYDYDGLGNLLTVREPSKNTVLVEMEYDDDENLVAEVDGNKNTKKLDYDELTRIVGVTHWDTAGKTLAETKVAYDEAVNDRYGNSYLKVSVTNKGDQQDRVVNYYFDTFERLAKLGRFKDGKEEFSHTKYDYLGNQVEISDFAGIKSKFEYDALSQLVKATDAEGSSTKYKYDRLGNMIAQTDPLGQTTYLEYDKLGRNTVIKAPFEKGKFSIAKNYFDGASNLVKVVDPEGFITKQHFNNTNQLSAVERVISSKESNISRYEYDKAGNITKVHKGLNSFTDKNYSTFTYSYDELNRLIMMADAAGKQTLYEYDINSNLLELTDRNKVETKYTYDGLNRLTFKQNSKNGKKNTVKITYDKLGQTRQMMDASGNTIFDYDALGRLITVNYGNGIRQQYTYDKADRVNNLRVMQGNLKQMDLKYLYDKVGRLTNVNYDGKNHSYKYDAAGRLSEEMNKVTGIRSDYRYYPSGNIHSLRHFQGKDLVSSYEYRYDARGNQIQKNEGKGTYNYFYDPLSRIKTVFTPEKSIQEYKYDDLDNISKLTEITGTSIEETDYLYDRNSRLLLQETKKGSELIQKRFTYDANGKQLTKNEAVKRNGALITSYQLNYDYDGYNQLQRVRQQNGRFIEYTYNGSGLRTKKDFGDSATNYYYNGGNIILETDQANRVTAKNIRGLRIISRETQNNNPLFYLHNAHGDVTQLVDNRGKVLKDYRYDVWGQEESTDLPAFGGGQTKELWRKEVEKIDNPFRYCGEYLDEETGNYYLRARYYDPSIQRFINEDSFGVFLNSKWTRHLYTYCRNNPIRYIDPSGHVEYDDYNKKPDQYGNRTDAKLIINGNTLNSWISGGNMYVGLRDVIKAMGGSVVYDAANEVAKASVQVGGRPVHKLYSIKDYPIINGRIQIPVWRLVKDFDLQKSYDAKTKTAYLKLKQFMGVPPSTVPKKETIAKKVNNNSNDVSNAAAMQRGLAEGAGMAKSAKLIGGVGTAADVIAIVSDGLDQSAKNQSKIKAGIKTTAHGAVSIFAGALVTVNSAAHMGAVFATIPEAIVTWPVLGISMGGTNYAIMEMSNQIQNAIDVGIDETMD